MTTKRSFPRLLVALSPSLLGLATPVYGNNQPNGDEAGARAVTARAELRDCADIRYSVGVGYLRERASTERVKEVDVMLRVWSLTEGKHAVHIHKTAQFQPCTAAGGHFDLGPHSNSNPDGNHPCHAGDLINIEVDRNGRGLLSFATSRVSLSPGPLSLFDEDGSAFVIHVHPDSYCPEGPTAGCAGGARAACALIVRD